MIREKIDFFDELDEVSCIAEKAHFLSREIAMRFSGLYPDEYWIDFNYNSVGMLSEILLQFNSEILQKLRNICIAQFNREWEEK